MAHPADASTCHASKNLKEIAESSNSYSVTKTALIRGALVFRVLPLDSIPIEIDEDLVIATRWSPPQHDSAVVWPYALNGAFHNRPVDFLVS